MTSRKWVRLFIRTLLLGAIATILTSFFVKTDSYSMFLDPLNIWEIFGALLWFMGIGFIFSIVSQTGFFAYLFINQFGLSIFRGYWGPVQFILIVFVLFDLVYFPYKNAPDGSSIIPYVVTALVILGFGLAVAYVKAKETKRTAFLPALFFMVVVTVIEWVPVLRTNDPDWMMLMIVPLLACNTYQLLLLHRINPSPDKQNTKDVKNNK
ncbi:KinB-signaling pathway activation protein [Salinibacillus xinjiangensis]|uniref:KinB-signaling pathway activation protein n=1 Tax=Salinibacillus xinjiangensis TaxID=1229268 RepID=A0A6G1XAV1_9BACI|nr:KinB-signaling pathway activation protein [Salinibacillus xinjiangensis]MRG88067.1 KinB-signaling pathway activation protein [Salinibacillus xinjiangensis]